MNKNRHYGGYCFSGYIEKTIDSKMKDEKKGQGDRTESLNVTDGP